MAPFLSGFYPLAKDNLCLKSLPIALNMVLNVHLTSGIKIPQLFPALCDCVLDIRQVIPMNNFSLYIVGYFLYLLSLQSTYVISY